MSIAINALLYSCCLCHTATLRAGVFVGWQLENVFVFSRAAINQASNKATILKAVGSSNEAAATKLVADLDLGLGEPFDGVTASIATFYLSLLLKVLL